MPGGGAAMTTSTGVVTGGCTSNRTVSLSSRAAVSSSLVASLLLLMSLWMALLIVSISAGENCTSGALLVKTIRASSWGCVACSRPLEEKEEEALLLALDGAKATAALLALLRVLGICGPQSEQKKLQARPMIAQHWASCSTLCRVHQWHLPCGSV
jgi:hypothetical protein